VIDHPTIDVPRPPGGWGAPWPNVAEIEAVLPQEKWTLVGGLMTQAPRHPSRNRCAATDERCRHRAARGDEPRVV
jgi:hypothetical protein